MCIHVFGSLYILINSLIKKGTCKMLNWFKGKSKEQTSI